ncbi:hypothetical protein V8C86DRAFT_2780269, partial [Haematococcus lacustris]
VGQQLPGVWGSCPVALLLLPCCAAVRCCCRCTVLLPCQGEAVGQRLWGRGGRGSREQIREQQGPQKPYLQPVCD